MTGARWDYLAWNRAATIITGGPARMEGIERNAIYQLFTSARIRGTLVDWELHARGLVALPRLDYARWLEDSWFNKLVRELEVRSPEFRDWWRSRDVTTYEDGVKHYEPPDLGRLSFTYSSLRLADERFRDLSLITYVPVDGTGTRERVLERLSSLPA